MTLGVAGVQAIAPAIAHGSGYVPSANVSACTADFDDGQFCIRLTADQIVDGSASGFCSAAVGRVFGVWSIPARFLICPTIADLAEQFLGDAGPDAVWLVYDRIAGPRLGTGEPPPPASTPPLAPASTVGIPVRTVDFGEAIAFLDTYLDTADLADGSGVVAAWNMLSPADQNDYVCGGFDQFSRFWGIVRFVDPQNSWRFVGIDPITGWLTIDVDLRYVYHDRPEEVDDARFIVGRRADGLLEIVDYDPDRDAEEFVDGVQRCGETGNWDGSYRAEPPTGPLRIGDHGPRVEELQLVLNQTGFLADAPDGYFGPITRAAVESFQRAAGLEVDGIAGPRTLAALGLD